MHLGWTTRLEGFVSSSRKAPPLLDDEVLFTEWEGAGHFWLPENPEKKLWGKAVFSPGDKVTVVVEGSFWSRSRYPGGIECPALNGVLFNGAHCTVFDSICHIESYRSDKEYRRSTLESSLMIIGGHFSNPGEIRLQSISVAFSHLNDWFRDPYDLRYKRGGYEKALVCFSPDAFEVESIFETESFTLSTFCTRTIPSASSSGKLEFTSRYVLVAKPHSGQSLPWFLSLAGNLRSYLMLLIGCGVYTLELTGTLANPVDTAESEKTLPARVHVYLPVSVPLLIQTDIHRFVSHYSQISSEFTVATKAWFEHRKVLETVIRAYTEILQQDGASEETIFLRVVQTLEHLHGIVFSEESNYLPKSGWKTFCRWLRKNVPDPLPGAEPGESSEGKSTSNHSLRGLVLNRIGWLNRLSFRSRLERLFREIPGRTLMPIFDNPHPEVVNVLDEYLRAIEATRNYLTHYDEQLKKKALSGEELEMATARCWAVLTYWIATSIGFSAEKAGRMALNAKRAMFLVEYRTQL